MEEIWAMIWCSKDVVALILGSALLMAFAIIGMVASLMWLAGS